jgi:hypothetical protein
VVLHLFPDDIVPSLALENVVQPVIFVNNSDHTFWVGRQVSTVFALLRDIPGFSVEEYRGIDASSTSILPIPLPACADSSPSRDDAKRALGLSPDTVVLATVASSFKFAPLDGLGFLDLVTPVLKANPDARLLAVGPAHDGAWSRASALADGRIRAFGSTPETALVYRAADIYLDSYPFSSITSLLEAGSLAVPLLVYTGTVREAPLLAPGAPGLDPVIVRAIDPGAYRAVLQNLIDSRQLRASIGAATRESIQRHHTGDGWRGYLANVYEKARSLERRDSRQPIDDGDPTLQDALLNTLLSRLSIGLGPVADTYFDSLPYFRRFCCLCRLATAVPDFSKTMLLPPPLQARCEGNFGFVRAALNRARS